MNKRYTIQTILLTSLWILIGAGTVVLLVAAIQKKDEQHCKGVAINISGVNNNFFVDKKDIKHTISSISGGDITGKAIGSFNLKAIEQALQRNVWIKNAQLYFDNNEVLQVNVLEREPVARVFTSTGSTFYLDTSATMLPLSDKFSARLPVFTNFPSDKKVLLKADSLLLQDILVVAEAIHADSFLMAMIDQVDITEQRSFEMIPKVGNTLIVFGDGKHVTEKFNKLQMFYKQVMVKSGWNRYSAINVQYKGQVVADRKGAQDVKADSLRTLQLMKAIAENAERMSADTLQVITQDNEQNTTNGNLIQQSIERDDRGASTGSDDKTEPVNTNVDQALPETATAATPAKTNAAPISNTPPKTAVKTPAKTIAKTPSKTTGKTIVPKQPTAVKTNLPVSKPATGKPSAAKKTPKPSAAAAKQPKIVMPKSPAKKPVKTATNEY